MTRSKMTSWTLGTRYPRAKLGLGLDWVDSHHMMTLLLDGKLFLAPLGDNVQVGSFLCQSLQESFGLEMTPSLLTMIGSEFLTSAQEPGYERCGLFSATLRML